MSVPLVSIVIANYNYGRFLDEAIRSVLDQSCGDWELIICDGGSTDNSKEVIEKYAGRLAWWCSEKDKGQSDAFNKGFAHAKGKFLTWLNADDVMLPGVVEKLKSAAEKHPECEWFTGGSFWCDPEMKILKCNVARPFSEMRYRCGLVNVCGPSSFFAKALFDKVGGCDVRFKYTMDTDLWLKFAHQGVRFRVAMDYAYVLRLHPEAKMSGHNFQNGKLDFDVYNPERDPKHAQLEQEDIWMNEGHHFVPSTSLRHLASVSWIPVFRGLIATRRWKGHHYREMYK